MATKTFVIRTHFSSDAGRPVEAWFWARDAWTQSSRDAQKYTQVEAQAEMNRLAAVGFGYRTESLDTTVMAEQAKVWRAAFDAAFNEMMQAGLPQPVVRPACGRIAAAAVAAAFPGVPA